MMLSHQLRNAGVTLAAKIEGGTYDALTPVLRAELRQLSAELIGWGDTAAELEERLRPRTPRELRLVRIAPALAVVAGGRA